ncbi:MAG: glycosyltransferase family 4 protein [Nitrososphaerota archaeon]|nr:glycosyltransferase family 4 protein [Nitrososphaerota archaeon]MDG6942806.1 glycosyltransferase family 4 protein [Nitrososphaerota archaeon]MDG6950874.1 glycosyltransferase family 4 protein [Nitrososphaerota archaeon]
MRICVNTQTPPIRFRLDYSALKKKYGELDDPVDLKSLHEGVDYVYAPGGVTAMVLPLLSRLSRDGLARDSIWISLGIKYPPRVRLDGVLISHVELGERHLRDYGSFKEEFWSVIHGLGGRPFNRKEYLGYVHYNWANTEKIFHYVGDVDIFYIHDFQLIQTGQLIGISAPAVLRWHVPFRPENLGHLGGFVRRALEGFDSVIVSTKRDLEGLVKIGYRGHAHQLYPYIDEAEWKAPSPAAKAALRDKIGLKADEKLLLTVARMDPVKSQDVAIRALAKMKNKTKVKLLLIGNGSFSSSRTGGLGRDKGTLWKEHLITTAKRLKVRDRTVFLGYATAEDIRAAYSLAAAVVLPSRIEGFGITVLEGWINRKPAVVSEGAGVSELVIDGSNGYTFRPGDDEGLAEGALKAIGPGGEHLGDNGAETVKRCLVGDASKKVRAVLEETAAGYR